MRHCERPQSLSFPTAKGGRNEHEETINHDFYHCIFYNLALPFVHSLLKMTVPNRHSKQKKLQTIRISRKQKLPKTLKNRLPRWFPWVFLKLPVTALAEAAPQAGEETPVPVPLPAPSTPLLLTQE